MDEFITCSMQDGKRRKQTGANREDRCASYLQCCGEVFFYRSELGLLNGERDVALQCRAAMHKGLYIPGETVPSMS